MSNISIPWVTISLEINHDHAARGTPSTPERHTGAKTGENAVFQAAQDSFPPFHFISVLRFNHIVALLQKIRVGQRQTLGIRLGREFKGGFSKLDLAPVLNKLLSGSRAADATGRKSKSIDPKVLSPGRCPKQGLCLERPLPS